jgi:hypothetical protein
MKKKGAVFGFLGGRGSKICFLKQFFLAQKLQELALNVGDESQP